MRINKKHLPLIIAAITGVIAVFLINTYIRQQTEEAKRILALSQQSLTTVVVARQDIVANTVITEAMVKEESVGKNTLQPRAATSVDRVIDKITLVPLSRGEQILLNKLTIPGQEMTLSMKVPKGKRAITIPVDNISSVGGMIRPGDHVDVVGMVPIQGIGPEGKVVAQMTTLPLFQDVLVLAVGQEYTYVTGAKKEERERVAIPIITLALTPQEANLVAFVQEQSKIRLVLRSPGDAQAQPAIPASWDLLFRTVMPEAFKEQPIKPQRKVEIYRGLQKEEKILEIK